MTDRLQRRAVIDIGTNSVRLLVADLSRGDRPGDVALTPVLRGLETPRLGRGVDRARRLNNDAMQAAAAAVRAFAEQARSVGAKVVDVIGTSALRDAANRDEFLQLVKRECGLAVRVIDGQEEAELSFLGAVRGVHAAPPDNTVVYVLDVGGGSTELVRGSARGTMESVISVDVGAVRMTELCVRSDPISDGDWERLVFEVRSRLRSLWRNESSAHAPVSAHHSLSASASLLAVGGTATTLAAMKQRLHVYDPERVHGFALWRQDVEELIRALRFAPVAQRRTWPGLQPQRADIILAGAVIVHEVMTGLNVASVTVSESDLLEGVMLRSFETAEV